MTALLPLRVADVVVAFSPGAQDTMMVLALALHLDPVYVAAHHVVRFMVVTVTVPLLVRLWCGRRNQAAARAGGRRAAAEFED